MMNLITRDTDYAVRAILYCAAKGKGVVTAAELVQELDMPRPFIRKILQKLQKEGILSSSKGRGGGFILDRPLSKVRLIDVIEVFQGRLQMVECIFRKKICANRDTCSLRKELKAIEDFANKRFRSLTLDSLVDSHNT